MPEAAIQVSDEQTTQNTSRHSRLLRRSMVALLADCICTEPHHAGLDAEHSIMTADDAVLDCCLLSTLELLVNAQPVGYNKAPFCVHNTIRLLLAGCVQDCRSSQAIVW